MSEPKSERRLRKLTALSLAVSTVLPAPALSSLSQSAFGQVAGPNQTTSTPMPVSSAGTIAAAEMELLAAENETLRKATDQFRAGEYEESAATLSTIKLEDLSSGDRRAYDRLLTRVNEAVEGRKTARASYEKAETLIANGKLDEASKAYKAASSARFADQATRTKALEQIALIETQQRSAEVADRAAYAEARDLLDKGDLEAAKTKFQALADRGYKPGFLQRSPADYVNEISKRQGVPPVAPEAAMSAPSAGATPPAAPSGPTATEYYNQGVEQFRAQDYAAARKSFEAAQANGYRTGMFERSPGDYIKRIDQLVAASAAPVATAAPEAPAAPVAPAAPKVQQSPAVTVEGEPAPASMAPSAVAPAAADTTEQARAAYESGVAQFKSGNLDDAQKSFQAAKDLGFKTGLFQDSPEKWLARVDAKRAELAEADKAAAAKVAMEAQGETGQAKAADGRRYYTTGRDLYRKGDWIEARRNFVAAVDAGYKPGLFEDSAQKYLERMDRKEQADSAKAAPAMAMGGTSASAVSVGGTGGEAAAVATATPAAEVSTPAVDPIAKAQELVAQARAAQAAGENSKALSLYTEASALDPKNQQAVAGRNELVAMGAPQGSLLSEAEKNILGRRQVIQYSFDQAISSAKERTATGEFDAARQAVEQARTARNTDPTIFTAAEIARFDTDISVAQKSLDQAVSARAEADKESASRQQTQIEKDRVNQAKTERERTVSALIAQARQMVEDARYQEALGVIDQVLAIDPQNDYAQGVRPLVEDKAMIQQQRKYRDDYGTQLAKQFSRVDESLIPYDDLLRFPENWPDISDLRDAQNATRKGQTAVDNATIALLDKRLPEVRFENVAFGDVIDSLRDMTGANITVEWSKLEAAGIDRTQPVNLSRLTNQNFKKVLNAVLQEAGPDVLAFVIDQGDITISTKDEIGKYTIPIIYDISDLLFAPLNAGDPPEIEFELEPVTRGGGGGSGSNLFGNSGGGAGEEQNRTPEQIVEELIDIIQRLVPPVEQWAANGGQSEIRRFSTGSATSLIVTATRDTHAKLDSLLNQLRASSAVQVSVETRFLTVSRSFLEDIGLDIDVDLNLNGVNSPKFGSRTGVNQAFVNNVPIRQNSSSYTANPRTGLPSALSSAQTDTNPAFSVQATFLDDFSVDFLLRATQASISSSTAQAPRLTLFSGQRSRVIVGSYQYFVTDLTPIVGTGAVAFQPNPSAVFSGVQLWVEAVVSADRKYVQLNLVPQLRQLTGVQNFVFQTAATGDGGGGGGGGGGGLVTPVAGIATATIQLPTQSSTQVYTSASVPDGGTILLGGLSQGGEVQNEVGVPVLSKIPFIKRLFTNTSTAKDENVVLILVKPTIIIQHEVEAKTFPLLSGKVGQ